MDSAAYALGTTSAARSPARPDTPTIAEADAMVDQPHSQSRRLS
jgi:hypothetical protein